MLYGKLLLLFYIGFAVCNVNADPEKRISQNETSEKTADEALETKAYTKIYDKKISGLKIDAENKASISIKGHNENFSKIELTGTCKNEMSLEDDILKVEDKAECDNSCDYQIFPPTDTKVDISLGAVDKEVNISNINSDISLNIGAGKIELSNISGNVKITSGSGQINISNIKGDTSIRTGYGEIELTETEGDVNLTLGAGKVKYKPARSEEVRKFNIKADVVALECILPVDTTIKSLPAAFNAEITSSVQVVDNGTHNYIFAGQIKGLASKSYINMLYSK